jgi:Kef-type K+ transport system membrane component KefB
MSTAEEQMSSRRRDAWAYVLVGVDVAALILWTLLLRTDSDASVLNSDLFFFVVAPAALVLLGCLGFWMWGREWLAARPHERTRRSLRLVKWAAILVLTPLCFYAFLALLVVAMSPEFD